MSPHDRGLQLRSRDGHFEMVAFEIKRQERGFWMWVACDFDGHQGGHWLAPDLTNTAHLVVSSEPYLWPTATDAYAARDRWEQQQEA